MNYNIMSYCVKGSTALFMNKTAGMKVIFLRSQPAHLQYRKTPPPGILHNFQIIDISPDLC